MANATIPTSSHTFDPPPSLQDACLLSIGSNLHRFDITGLGTDGLSHDIAARLLQASADEKTLDDESLLYLLSLCGAQLESFSIPFANVTAGAIDQAVAALPCAALLRLNGLPVNDDTLIVIAKKCPALTDLRLYGCTEFGDRGLLAFTQHAARKDSMRGLDISLTDDARLTASGITAFAEHHAGSLESLCLAWCMVVDDNLLATLAGTCRNLTELVLARCRVRGLCGVEAVVWRWGGGGGESGGESLGTHCSLFTVSQRCVHVCPYSAHTQRGEVRARASDCMLTDH